MHSLFRMHVCVTQPPSAFLNFCDAGGIGGRGGGSEALPRLASSLADYVSPEQLPPSDRCARKWLSPKATRLVRLK
jgi:hypothetical protein